MFIIKVKERSSCPCTCNKGIKGEWRHLHTFLTSALDGDEWSGSRPGHFIPRERVPLLIEQEAGWAPEPVWMFWRR